MKGALLLTLLLAGPHVTFALPLPPSLPPPVEEIQRALCSLRTEHGQLAAHASVSRQLVGACQAKEVREHLRLIHASLLGELRALRQDIRMSARQAAPVVFKYI